MNRSVTVILAGVVATASVEASAQPVSEQAGCRHHKSFAGMCFMLRGRVGLYQGWPDMRIWPIGSKRLLGVLPSENEDVPETLANLFRTMADGAHIYGKFEASPLSTEQPGQMQYVCIRSARDIRVTPKTEHQLRPN